MELFDILKTSAGIPVVDLLPMLFAAHSGAAVTVYRTPDNQIYADSDGSVYALKEE